jgi:hypothetical protein
MLSILTALSNPERAYLQQMLFKDRKSYPRTTHLRILLSGPLAPSEEPPGVWWWRMFQPRRTEDLQRRRRRSVRRGRVYS